jgi:molybdopterin-containing oxidoreductase family membrane subunit
LSAERVGEAPPSWIKPVIILSIPWAVSIHTVTAFLYSGLAARPFWMTAILAPRFLASAFSAGPALLIMLALIIRKLTDFDPGKEAIDKLSTIVAYAMSVNVFFVCMELFTALYSSIPEHVHHFEYLFLGLEGDTFLAPFMWVSGALSILALVLLLNPNTRRNEKTLVVACIAVFAALWIEKGLGMVIAGFVPTPLGAVTSYRPTLAEIAIVLGVYSIGALMITGFYRIALAVRGELKRA